MKCHFDIIGRKNSLLTLLTLGTQINHGFQTQLPDATHVICSAQSIQTVRTKQRSPPGASSICGCVPAQVTKVVNGLKTDQSPWMIDYLVYMRINHQTNLTRAGKAQMVLGLPVGK